MTEPETSPRIGPITILFVGDVVGEPGVNAVRRYLPGLIDKFEPELVIVNAENVYDGKGIRPGDVKDLRQSGAEVLTSGNHIWERWQSKRVLESDDRVLRPLNYPPGNAGSGLVVHSTRGGRRVAVANLQGRTFMTDIDCPFRAFDDLRSHIDEEIPLIIDFHAEATAEKIAFARYVNGRASAVIGTHTHVPTADAQILSKGTAYITDSGMTGPYDSVIGMKSDPAIKRFLYKTPYKYEVAEGELRLCGVLLRIEPAGRAMEIQTIAEPPFVTSGEDPSLQR